MYLFFLFVGCPVVSFTPTSITTPIETSATFKAVVASYFDEALESRWSSATGIIDTSNSKFIGSKNIPFPELVINNVTFEDDGLYELQVRIDDGWCIGNTVTLDIIGGSYITYDLNIWFINLNESRREGKKLSNVSFESPTSATKSDWGEFGPTSACCYDRNSLKFFFLSVSHF